MSGPAISSATFWGLCRLELHSGYGIHRPQSPGVRVPHAHNNQRLMRWSLLLQDFNVEIKHIKGSHNVVADALSRAGFKDKHVLREDMFDLRWGVVMTLGVIICVSSVSCLSVLLSLPVKGGAVSLCVPKCTRSGGGCCLEEIQGGIPESRFNKLWVYPWTLSWLTLRWETLSIRFQNSGFELVQSTPSMLKVSFGRFFVNFAVVSSINECPVSRFLWKRKCSGAPVSGCSSLEEAVGGEEREVFASYSWIFMTFKWLASDWLTALSVTVSQSEASDPSSVLSTIDILYICYYIHT